MSVDGPVLKYDNIVEACLRKYFPDDFQRIKTTRSIKLLEEKTVVSSDEELNQRKKKFGFYCEEEVRYFFFPPIDYYVFLGLDCSAHFGVMLITRREGGGCSSVIEEGHITSRH